MNKLLRVTLIMGSVLLLAGCSALAAPTQAQIPPTAMPQTPTIIYMVITATPAPTDIPTSTPLPTETPLVLPTDTATALVLPTNTAVAATSAATAKPTAVPSSYDAAGNPISASGTITITSIKNNNSGKAQITWTATGSHNNGFWIYYSESYKYPYYGGYPEFMISDGTTRVAYLDGTAGTTYYYRICAYTGSGCEYYSNPVSYTFPSATATP